MESRFEAAAGGTAVWDPGREVLVAGPDMEGRDVRDVVVEAAVPLTEGRVAGVGRGRAAAAVVDVRGPPTEGRVGAAAEDNCFVGDFVGD